MMLLIQGLCAIRRLGRPLTQLLSTDRGFLYVTGGTAGSAVLAGLFWFAIANLLDVESYGKISYYVALGSTLAAVGSLGLGTALTTFLAKGDKDFGRQANSLVLLLGLFSGALVSLIDPILGLFVVAVIFFNMGLSSFLGKRSYKVYSGISIAARALQIVLSVYLFFVLGFSGILLGYTLSLLLFSYGFLSSHRGFRLHFGALSNHRNFIVHTYGTSLLRVSSTYLDKIVIGMIFGFGALGIYTISSQFLLLLATLPGAVYQYLLPQISAGFKSANIKKMSLVGASIMSAASIFIVPILIRNFFPNYSDSILPAQIMMVALVPYTFSAIARAELYAKEKSRIVLEGMSILTVSLVVTLIALGSSMGVVGLAVATVIAFALQAIYLWIRTLKN